MRLAYLLIVATVRIDILWFLVASWVVLIMFVFGFGSIWTFIV